MLIQAKVHGVVLARLPAMVSRSHFVHRPGMRGWVFGLLLLVHGFVWACADPVGDGGVRIGRWAGVASQVTVHTDTHGAGGAMPDGAAARSRAAAVMAPAGHPCGGLRSGANPSGQPGADRLSTCAGLCAALCLPAAAAGSALPCASGRLPAEARAEACPVGPGWAVTGRSVPPESPPPIV